VVGLPAGWPLIETDIPAQLAKIQDAVNPAAARAVRHGILSYPISYIYNPYACTTMSYVTFAFHSCANDVSATGANAWINKYGIVAEYGQAAIESVGGPAWPRVTLYGGNAEEDITTFDHMPWWATGFADDDGTPIRAQVMRTK